MWENSNKTFTSKSLCNLLSYAVSLPVLDFCPGEMRLNFNGLHIVPFITWQEELPIHKWIGQTGFTALTEGTEWGSKMQDLPDRPVMCYVTEWLMTVFQIHCLSGWSIPVKLFSVPVINQIAKKSQFRGTFQVWCKICSLGPDADP